MYTHSIVLAVSSTPASGLFFEESLNPLDWYYKVVCKTGCPINYDPKCAFRTADGTFLEFNNQCELDAKKCIDGAAGKI